jgi:hypothetical protein
MSVARPRLCALWAVTALVLGACSTTPPTHYTRLWPDGRTGLPLIGTSTEDGIVILSTPGLALDDLYEIQFPYGNSLVVDWGRIDRMNDVLAVVRPVTARLAEGRIAASPPEPDERLYLALRDERDEPRILPLERWRDGVYGDYVLLDTDEPQQVAAAQRGTGVYVRREGRWEIVGVRAGRTAVDEADPRGEVALGYIGLRELARILPNRIAYFERDLRPLRPDFEFGVPLQPGDIDLGTAPPPEGTPPPGATPAPKPTPPKAPPPKPSPR